jgi:hypothetical protein
MWSLLKKGNIKGYGPVPIASRSYNPNRLKRFPTPENWIILDQGMDKRDEQIRKPTYAR